MEFLFRFSSAHNLPPQVGSYFLESLFKENFLSIIEIIPSY